MNFDFLFQSCVLCVLHAHPVQNAIQNHSAFPTSTHALTCLLQIYYVALFICRLHICPDVTMITAQKQIVERANSHDHMYLWISSRRSFDCIRNDNIIFPMHNSPAMTSTVIGNESTEKRNDAVS